VGFRYIEDLQRKIALLERGENETFSPQSLEQDGSVLNNGKPTLTMAMKRPPPRQKRNGEKIQEVLQI
jgi:hypothetical protein